MEEFPWFYMEFDLISKSIDKAKSMSEEGATTLVNGDCVLQISSPLSVKSKYPGMQDRIVTVDSQSTIPSLGITGKEVIAIDKPPLLANDSSADA